MPGVDFSAHVYNPTAQGPAAAANAAKSEPTSFGFGDLIDAVNPLQHIPVVSTLYRHLSGDKIDLPAKIAGDALYGGVIGLVSSLGDALFTELTGKSVGDTVYAAVVGDDAKTAANGEVPVKVEPAAADIRLPDIGRETEDVIDGVAQKAMDAYHAAAHLIEAL